jgi:hypothetical protein
VKTSSTLTILAAVLALSACGHGKDKAGLQRDGVAAPVEVPVVVHKAQDCPDIAGTYGPADGSKLESLSVEAIDKAGLKFTYDSGPDTYETLVDGKERLFGEPVYYKGSCVDGKVKVQFYNIKKEAYANTDYSLNEKQELVIVQTNIGDRAAANGFPPGTRAWVKKDSAPPQTPN